MASLGRIITLEPLRRWSDLALFLLRLGVGAFLIWGVWDNISSPAHMDEFVTFLDRFGFPFPEFMAPLSVWVQFFCGAAFILGLFTGWAGLLCAANFIVAIVMVDRFGGIRGSFPSAALVLIGLYLAAHGPGRYGLDALFASRRRR